MTTFDIEYHPENVGAPHIIVIREPDKPTFSMARRTRAEAEEKMAWLMLMWKCAGSA